MTTLLILPNQLFDKQYIPKDTKIIIWEHPHYFEKYNYNKKKLILHRASMKYYYDYLLDNNYDVINYIDIANYNKKTKDYLNKIQSIKVFDPIDEIDHIPKHAKILDSPNFLLSAEMCQEYHNKTDKFFFHAFYTWSKKQLDIIPNIKSKDKDNRKTKIPDNLKIHSLPKLSKDDKYYINNAAKFVQKEFKDNLGTIDNFEYPVSHSTAKKWLRDFLNKKFKNFGDYQDTIVVGEDYLFHSVLSSSINIGLLCPDDIIDEVAKYKSRVPINSYEGYIRQLFWREYQRYTYKYFDFSGNYFGNKKKLTKEWYNYKGQHTLGIPPVDDAIRRGIETGYLHHILRLMVVGNYMNLSGISPEEGFKWFMEFSCDSYEWVMYQNVYEMVFFVSGGGTMRKPYISSSNYVLKMSDYSGKGVNGIKWTDIWDEKYRAFIKKNKKKLYKFRYYFRNI